MTAPVRLCETDHMSMGLDAFKEELGSDVLQAVYDHVGAGLVITDLEGYIRHCNPTFQAMLGRTASELQGCHFTELTHPDDQETSRARFQSLLSGPEPQIVLEKRYLRGDGSVFWAQSTLSQIQATAERPAYAVCVVTSIEQQKTVEADLRESEARFQAFMKQVPAAAWITDRNLRLIYVNGAFERLLGMPPADLIGRNASDFYPPEIARQHLDNIAKVMETGAAIEEVEDALLPDGSPARFLVHKYPVPLPGPGPEPSILVGGLAFDLTERLRAERALQESEARFRALAETVPQLVWSTRADGDCDYLSPQWAQFTGRPVEEQLGGTRWTEVLHPEDRSRAARAFLQAVHNNTSYDIEYRIRSASGQYRWFKTRGIALRDTASGEVIRWIGSCTDIDDQHRHQEELGRLNGELEAARDAALEGSRAKSAFLANMSHELRTPLNAIIGYAEMLCDVADDENRDDLKADLSRIHGAGQHLLGLINSILDLSKIEAGRMEIQIEEFHPGDLVHRVIDTLAPLASQRRNQLEVVASWDLGEMVSDAGKLRQILINLIGNACKFTEEGVVRVEVWGERADAEAGPRDWMSFSVSDTGPGISHADQRRLFQDFVQLAPPPGGIGSGGTGLGLAITQHFCSMLGGTITLESEPGRGSTFTVRLPRRMGA